MSYTIIDVHHQLWSKQLHSVWTGTWTHSLVGTSILSGRGPRKRSDGSLTSLFCRDSLPLERHTLRQMHLILKFSSTTSRSVVTVRMCLVLFDYSCFDISLHKLFRSLRVARLNRIFYSRLAWCERKEHDNSVIFSYHLSCLTAANLVWTIPAALVVHPTLEWGMARFASVFMYTIYHILTICKRESQRHYARKL